MNDELYACIALVILCITASTDIVHHEKYLSLIIDISSTTTTSVAARFTVASSNSVIFTSYDGTITHTTNSIQQYNSIIQPFTSITTTDYESTSLMSTNINTIRTTTKAATPTNNQNSEKFEIMAKTTITIGAVLGSVIVIFIVVLILLVILGIRHIKQKKMAQHQCGIPERYKHLYPDYILHCLLLSYTMHLL